jgi:hypothetical protein
MQRALALVRPVLLTVSRWWTIFLVDVPSVLTPRFSPRLYNDYSLAQQSIDSFYRLHAGGAENHGL